jgi:hypothetical protein
MNRPAHWRGDIFSPSELRRTSRRLDRRLANVDQVLTAMKRGASLHLEFENGRTRWFLSSGRTVPASIAEIVANHASVHAVGDALFANVPSQTWRIIR